MMSNFIAALPIIMVLAAFGWAFLCINRTSSQMQEVLDRVYEARIRNINSGCSPDVIPYPDVELFGRHFWLLFFFLSPDHLYADSISAITNSNPHGSSSQEP